jgi:hypothetical protein
MIEKIEYKNLLLSIIIRAQYKNTGIHFFTDNIDSQQLGYMNRPSDYEIPPHRHNLIPREIHLTQEVLIIKSGKIRVDFYSNDQIYIESRILYTGDIILLSDGGHGFQMLEDSEIFEVKQGPYCGDQDKVRFKSVPLNHLNIIY